MDPLRVLIADDHPLFRSGLRALLEARRRAEDGGGEIALQLHGGGPVARLLELTGVTSLFARRDGDGS